MAGSSLYDQFHTDVSGVGPLHDVAHEFMMISQDHQQQQDELRTALSVIKVSYSGTAADGMQDAFQPLIDALGDGSQKAIMADQSLQDQSGHFRVAQAQIQKTVPVPPEPWYDTFDPMDTAYDDALLHNSGIDTTNQAAFAAYGSNTTSNDVPRFRPPLVSQVGKLGTEEGIGTVSVTSGPQLDPGVPTLPGASSRPRGPVSPNSTHDHVPASDIPAGSIPNGGGSGVTGNGGGSSVAGQQAAGAETAVGQHESTAGTGSVATTGTTDTQGYSGPPRFSPSAIAADGSPSGGSSAASGGVSAAVGSGAGATDGVGLVGGFGPPGAVGAGGSQSGMGMETERATSSALVGAGRTGSSGTGVLGPGQGGRKREDGERTTTGRWLLKHRADNGGVPWVVAAPASFELLVTETRELLRAVRD